MKNLSSIYNNIVNNAIIYNNFVKKQNKNGIYYFADYWGIGLCKEYDNDKKYHIYYYPYINGKHIHFLNDKNSNDFYKAYIFDYNAFYNFAESIIRNNNKIPLNIKCIFKFKYKNKIYFESGQYCIDEFYYNEKLKKDVVIRKVILYNTKATLDKSEILGWYPLFKFKKALNKEFNIELE